MRRYLEPEFLKCSYAYQEGKGIFDAVKQAQTYIEAGYTTVVEIDIENFFDMISLERLMSLIQEKITDETVIYLIRSYLYCKVAFDDSVKDRKKGIIQGNSMSPVLSNLYLHALDQYMEEKRYKWIRFADNINIYTQNQDEAIMIYEDICKELRSTFELEINERKSGIYDGFTRWFLGYDFYKVRGKVEARKHRYQKMETYYNWHPCVVQKVNHEYYIVQNGILNKHDYSLLFENDKEKHHIPVEVVEQMNVYGDITITSNVLKTFSDKNIRVAFLDKYGDLMGYYVPGRYEKSSFTVLKQCSVYNDNNQRLQLARQIEIAGIHNMRANIRYYNKRQKNILQDFNEALSKCIVEVNEAATIGDLQLIEARARQQYYMAFNSILRHSEFAFEKRTRRPPQDELNAMISFGNTMLYNKILQIIWKTSLDSRIGIIHAANRRSHTLNLDFADLFKPIIVDRIIFKLINCMQIKKDEHFEKNENGGIYLNEAGKRIFIEEFESKMGKKLIVKGQEYTYRKLMEREIGNFQKYILKNEKYKPYKYY